MPNTQAGLLPIDLSRHTIIRDCGIARWLDESFAGRPLFVYRHRKTGNFVIAERIGNNFMHEWLVIGPSLDTFDREKADTLRRRVYTSQAEAAIVRRLVSSAERAAMNEQNEEFEEFRDNMAALRGHVRSNAKRDDPMLRAAAGLDA